MLEDRPYMRRSSLPTGGTAVTWLLVANFAAFVLQSLFFGFPLQLERAYDFALSVDGLRHGHVWQLLTFQFMHAGVLHLLFNCLAIFMFGRAVEEAVGRKSLLALYFCSGIVGGLFQVLAGALFGGVFSQPTVGASAGAFGLVAAFAMLYPDRPVTVLLIILPITMRARWFLIGSAILAILFILFPINYVANAAHLGGLLVGVIFIRFVSQWQWPRFRFRRRLKPRQLVKVRSRSSESWQQAPPASQEMSSEDFLSSQVDPILDKISKHGIQSLSERERKILESARKRMSK